MNMGHYERVEKSSFRENATCILEGHTFQIVTETSKKTASMIFSKEQRGQEVGEKLPISSPWLSLSIEVKGEGVKKDWFSFMKTHVIA